jgi:hypothetical protein
MTISIQNTVTTSLITTLGKVLIANDFQTDIVKVRRGIKTVEDFEGNMPGFAITKLENDTTDGYQGGSENLLNFRIWGYVECESEQDNYDALDKIGADLEKIILMPTYNSYATNTFIGTSLFYEGGVNENFGIIEMDINVVYFNDFGTS